jgi:hypothetical protein
MNDNLEAYVLDTSAWLTLIEDENGADVVQNILEKSREGGVLAAQILARISGFSEEVEGFEARYGADFPTPSTSAPDGVVPYWQ